MAPRKRATNAQPKPADPQPTAQTPRPASPVLADATDDISAYPEIQQNEFLATEAIYPDGFVRIRGRKDAWKNQENLAFRVQLTSLVDAGCFVKIEFEFPKEYPKVLPKIGIIEIQPNEPKLKAHIQGIIKTVPSQHSGVECVHEVTGAIDDLINRTAHSRANKQNPYSLEEERARKEEAAKVEAQVREELATRQSAEAQAQKDQILASQLENERKRRQQTSSVVDNIMHVETVQDAPPGSIHFDQTMEFHVAETHDVVKFRDVLPYYVIRTRSEKTVSLATPVIPDKNRASNSAQLLLLKEIKLSSTLAPRSQLQRTMEEVEKLLEASKRHRHPNIVELLGYKVLGPSPGDDFWRITIVSEFAIDQSLEDVLQISGTLNTDKIRDWSIQLLDALSFFVSNGYVHPAIHSSNVLLFRSRSGVVTLKLSDGYGTALRELVDKAADPTTPTLPVQAQWKAPELLLRNSTRTRETCIWEFGKLLLQMALGANVFEKYTSPRNCLDEADFSAAFEDLLALTFKQEPKKRPQPHKLRLMDFFMHQSTEVFNSASSNHPIGPMTRRLTGTSNSIWETKWTPIETLGKGGFGQVVKARFSSDQQVYAVKIIKNEESDILNSILEEVANISTLNHPAIVRYYQTFTDETDLPDDHRELARKQLRKNERTNPKVTSPIKRTDRNAVSRGVSGRHQHAKAHQSTQKDSVVYDHSVAHDFMTEPSMAELSQADLPDPGNISDSGGGMFAIQSNPGTDDEEIDTDEAEEEDSRYDNQIDAANLAEPSNNLHFPESQLDEPEQDFIEFGRSEIANPFADDAASNRKSYSSMDDIPSATHSSEVNRHREMAQSTQTRKTRITKLYIVMELCEKRNLRTLINHNLAADITTMWRLFRVIVDGLRYIHGKGFIHRDLKPENIFLDSANNPKIGDFGLATPGTMMTQGTSPEKSTIIAPKEVGVGTFLYMAPEVKTESSRPHDSKLDMYSLGIMLFEMNYFMKTFLERLHTLEKLNTPTYSLPKRFSEEAYQVQGGMILQLIDHDPAQRPSAEELLKSGKIPEPLEEEVFQRRIIQMSSADRQALITKLMVKENALLEDLAWDFHQVDQNSNLVITESICDKLKSIFHRHGAVSMDRPAIVPMANYYSNAFPLLDASGLVLQLVYDLTLPYARYLANNTPEHPKSYSFGLVYRNRKDTSVGDEPLRVPEVDFDFVSHKSTDLALKEAEVIYVLGEILCEIPALQSRSWIIQLNHLDLLDLILDYCNVQKADYAKVKAVLSSLNVGRMKWAQVRETLRSDELNIAETAVLALEQFNLTGSITFLEARLTDLLEGDERLGRALSVLARLNGLITYLETLKFRHRIEIAVLSNNFEYLYAGSLVFQCINKNSRKVLAAGGRYDSLIAKYQKKTPMTRNRAVGFRLNIKEVVALIRSDLQEGQKSQKAIGKDRYMSTAPSRCDVLVTSFDTRNQQQACLECVHSLWNAGISADLTEEHSSMEQLDRAHEKDGPCWLVIVKGGSSGDKALKVRSPNREETEVRRTELVLFLERALAGRNIQEGGAKLHRLTSSGHGGGDRGNIEVQVLPPSHKSKKVNRAAFVEQATTSAKELAQSLTDSDGLVVCIDAAPDFLQSLRNTRLADDSSWRSFRSSVPSQERNYVDEIQSTLKTRADAGKEGAFLYSYTAKTIIYYDFGKAN